MRLHLLIKGFLHLFFYTVFLHLLIPYPLILHHFFLHGRLLNQLMLQLHVLEPFLFFQFLIILVDFLVLAKIFVLVVPFVKIVILVLQILHLCLSFFLKFVLLFLIFLPDLLVKWIQDWPFHVFSVSLSLFFGFVTNLQVISILIVLYTWVFIHLQEPCVFLFGLLDLNHFFIFLSFLLFLEVIGLLSDELIIPAISLFFLLVEIIFRAELTIKLASKKVNKNSYLKFNFFYIAKCFYFYLSLSNSRALYWLIRAHYYFWGESYCGG